MCAVVQGDGACCVLIVLCESFKQLHQANDTGLQSAAVGVGLLWAGAGVG